MEKQEFVLRTQFYDSIAPLTLEQKGILLDMMFQYHRGEKVSSPRELKKVWQELKTHFCARPLGQTIADKIRKREILENDFWIELQSYVNMYGEEMIREFYAYWTEPTQNKTQNRKGQQRTWDTARRLAVWDKNATRYNHGYNRVNNLREQRNNAVQQYVLNGIKEDIANRGTDSIHNENILAD